MDIRFILSGILSGNIVEEGREKVNAKALFWGWFAALYHIWLLRFFLYNGIMYYPLLWSSVDKSARGLSRALQRSNYYVVER
jgi:hypothetical protein